MSIFKHSCFIFDLDGTLADNRHRQCLIETPPKQWDAYFKQCGRDTPYWDVVEIALELQEKYKLVFVSGRSERTDDCMYANIRELTETWLSNLNLSGPLFMRKGGDHRPDHLVKYELYTDHVRNSYKVLGVFDDRDRVVTMWRSLGLRCYQVQPGAF